MLQNFKFIPFEDLLSTTLRNGLTRPKAVRGLGVKMINMGELFAHSRIKNISMERVPLSNEGSDNFLLRTGDLLFARQSLVLSGAGKCSIFLGDSEPVTYEGHIIRARINLKIADPLFYYYFFNSPMGRKTIESIIEQVAAAGIRGSDLVKLQVPYPSLPIQHTIAHILGSLDDKIELNHAINEILEAMARAIFQSWFVDFDPVRAKMEGRKPEGMDADTAALFPDGFEVVDGREVPRGWRVGKVEEICNWITSGGTPSRMVTKYWDNGTISWFKTGELKDDPLIDSEERITELGLSESACKLWQPKTILIALYASPTVGRLGILEIPGTANQACSGLVAKPDFGFLFLYNSLLFSRNQLQNIAVGAAQQNINQQILREHKILIPDPIIAKKFQNVIETLYEKKLKNFQQSRTLAAFREALLPKLISGEIRIEK